VRASKWCRLASESAMKAAELLYQRGIVSYPRTETEVFAESFDLQALVHEHRASPLWGAFASKLLDDGGFQWPRAGAKNDQAHPPIHPLKFVPLESLADDSERRVYELIVRHFLACCSKDAEGAESVLRVQVAGEQFTATGLQVFHRNYLDVYPFEKWGERAMPSLVEGDTFVPTVLELAEGKTSPPELMSEAELIRIMDSTGIGTDATIADHIKTVQERQYVVKFGPQNRFKPTDLGLALVRTYNRLGHDRAISKPELRAAMERDLVRICRGETNKDAVVHSAVAKYRAILTSVLAHKDGFLQAVAENLSNAIAPADADYAELLAAQFSRCGRCRQPACELRRSAVNGVKALVCANCGVVCAPLPKPDDIRARAETCPICQYQVLEFASDPQRPPRAFCPSCFCHSPAEVRAATSSIAANRPPPRAPTTKMNAGDVEDVGQLPCFRCAKPGCALATGVQQTPVGECGTCGQPITVKRAQDRPSYYVQCTPRCPGARATVFVPSNAREVGVTADACPLCPRFRVLKLRFAPGDVPIAPPYELVECARTECRSHSSGALLFRRGVADALWQTISASWKWPRTRVAAIALADRRRRALLPRRRQRQRRSHRPTCQGSPELLRCCAPSARSPCCSLPRRRPTTPVGSSTSASHATSLSGPTSRGVDPPRRRQQRSSRRPEWRQRCRNPAHMRRRRRRRSRRLATIVAAATTCQSTAPRKPRPPTRRHSAHHRSARRGLGSRASSAASPGTLPTAALGRRQCRSRTELCRAGLRRRRRSQRPRRGELQGSCAVRFTVHATQLTRPVLNAVKCNAPGHFASSCPGAAAASTRATAFNSRQPFAQQQQQQQSGKPKVRSPSCWAPCRWLTRALTIPARRNGRGRSARASGARRRLSRASANARRAATRNQKPPRRPTAATTARMKREGGFIVTYLECTVIAGYACKQAFNKAVR